MTLTENHPQYERYRELCNRRIPTSEIIADALSLTEDRDNESTELIDTMDHMNRVYVVIKWLFVASIVGVLVTSWPFRYEVV